MFFATYIAILLGTCIAPIALCQSIRTESNTFDYIIVGGGTAGLVIASRLSEDPRVTVVIIEAGNFERHNPNATNTTILGIAKHTALDWQYESEPQIFVANKSLIWSAGKGLGGSSLINGRYKP
jgi:choline dehydrogenase-like flavoprotein